MRYMIWCFAFGAGLIVLTIVGESIADSLPENHWFSKLWRNHIIGEDPHNTDF